MENQDLKINPQRNGKKVVGGAILVVGIVLLAQQLGADIPSWLISWPVLLIIIGIANGFKHQFKNSGWLIMILIGSLFLLEKIVPSLSVSHFTWPIIIMGLGLWLLFGRKHHYDGCRPNRWSRRFNDFSNVGNADSYSSNPKNDEPVGKKSEYQTTGDEFIDSVSVFGGTKKNVLSKDFKGGDIVSILGGTEINLTHADINGVVVLDVVQIFGGTKIIIPPTWDVTSEMAAIFGGIDDKRSLVQVLPDRSKILLIKGTSIFGGIEVRNF